jgi:hypothetical protein
MVPDFPTLLAVADVDLAGSFGTNLGLLEDDTDAEGCTCPPLTFAAMNATTMAGSPVVSTRNG